ncbi:MAG TPA: LPS assembly lipoprotein LptE [Methyloceanibacter sp.]|jgi:LPS-assembly lipoprotein|nr:LPS assembly lipoprotein LptE [Methyloceanibacter sp.]
MWWRSHALIAALCACLGASALAGCGFQPLYGGTTAGGARLAEVMKGVDITPIPGRVGQKLRNELIFATTGGNNPAPTRYRVDIVIKESVTDQLVQITGDATGQIYQLDATFKLVNSGNGQVVYQGKAIARAPYNRFQEIFANVRARYDAENRAARTVAESIRTQLAAYLANAA